MRNRAGAPWISSAAGAVALVAVGLVILRVGHGVTFLQDEWVLIQYRLGGTLGTYLEPQNEHLVLVPVVLHKALFATVGADEYWPFLAVGIAAHLACLTLLFIFARPIVGRGPALLVLLPLLFIGAAWEVVLIPISEMQWCVSIAALLGLLLLLDRRDRRSEIACSLLLLLAFASSSLGVSIAAGTLVHVLWRPDRWRRIWIPVLPVLLYASWFLAYNRETEHQGPRQFPPSLRYVFDAAAGAMGGVLGLPIGGETTGPVHRAIKATVYLVTALSSLIVLWLAAVRRRVSARLAMLMVTLGSNWVLLAITRASIADPWSSRYIYVGAFLIVLIALELVRGASLGPRTIRVSAAIACAAGALNLVWLEQNARVLRDQSTRAAAQLGALEISRDLVDPSFSPDSWHRTRPVIAKPYFHATDQLGSPAMTPKEIAASSEYAREQADGVLLRAANVSVIPFTGKARTFIDQARRNAATPQRGPATLALSERRPGRAEGVLPKVGAIVRAAPETEAEIRVRRFADVFPAAPLATVGSTPGFLSLPLGRAKRPWHLQIAAKGKLRLLERGNHDAIARSSGRVDACEGTTECRRFVPIIRVAARTMRVVPGLVPGYVEKFGLLQGRLTLSGWAASEGLGAAERVAVFADGRLVAEAVPSQFRKDIADGLADSLDGPSRAAGFRIRARLAAGEGQRTPPEIRVFALLGDRVSEVPRVPGTPVVR